LREMIMKRVGAGRLQPHEVNYYLEFAMPTRRA